MSTVYFSIECVRIRWKYVGKMLIKWEFYQQAGFKALEGYITRRNSFSEKGTTGELNIWTGTTPPEDEVGVFVNSEIDDPVKYIVPYGGMYTDATWLQNQIPMPYTSFLAKPAMLNGLIYLTFGVSNVFTFYTHDPISDVYTNIATTTQSDVPSYFPTSGMASTFAENVLFVIVRGYQGYDKVCGMKLDTTSNVVSTIPYNTNLFSSSHTKDIQAAGTYLGRPYFVCECEGTTGSADGNDYFYIGYIDPETDTWGQTSQSPLIERSGYHVSYNSVYWNGIFYMPCTRMNTAMSHGTYSYNIATGAWPVIGVGQYLNSIWADDEFLYEATGQNVYTLPLASTSSTTPWTSLGAILPTYVNNISQSVAINTGTEFIIYECGPDAKQVLRYKYSKTDFEYPSVIVENGTQMNQAEIISGDSGTSTINVRRVYANENGTPVQVSGKVRITGVEWTDIQ